MDRPFQSRLILVVICAVLIGPGSLAAGQYEDIRKSGELVVGVKSDYAPYGFLDENENIVGIEPDLAQDIADLLGVKLKLVIASATDRIPMLTNGKIDLIMATMTDTEDRREEIDIVDPNYYSSGTNILAPENTQLDEWPDLDGGLLCGVDGALYNEYIEDEYDAEVTLFDSPEEMVEALEEGACVGAVYDESYIVSLLRSGSYDDLVMPLPTIDQRPWGIGIRKNERLLRTLLSGLIVDWHLNGRILELEKKYKIRKSSFAQSLNYDFQNINPAIKRDY